MRKQICLAFSHSFIPLRHNFWWDLSSSKKKKLDAIQEEPTKWSKTLFIVYHILFERFYGLFKI